MSDLPVEARVMKLLVERVDETIILLGWKTELKTLNWDSLDKTDMAYVLEDEFKFVLDLEEAQKWTTLQDVLDTVKRNVSPSNPS